MAIAYGTAGTLSYPTADAAAALPASVAAGDYLIMAVGNKPDTVVPAYPNDQTVDMGWTFLGYKAGGAGTTGIDTGPTSIAIFGRVADGTETGTQAVVLTGNSVSWVQIYRFTNATGHWAVACDGGVDSTTGAAWSVTVGSDIGLTSGDMCFVASCIPTDVTTPSQFTAEAVAATGVTMGTMTEISEPDSSLGQDIGGFTFYQPVSSGTSSAAATITATVAATHTNVSGPSLLVRLREIAAPAVTLVASAGLNFVASHTTAATSSFTVAVDDVIVIAVAADEPACTFGSISNTGTAFTWTLSQSRQTGGAAVPPTYVWTTTATAAQSMTVSITQTAGPTSAFWGISAHVFRGGTLGNTALNFGTASAASVNLTTSAANSAVSVFLADENGDLFTVSDTITAVGTSRVNVTHYENDLAWLNDLHWWHSDTGAAGSKTFGQSHSTMDWTIVAVEIAPATGNITASPSAIASAEAFGTAVISGALTVSPTAISTAEAFGTAVISTPLTATPTGIASSEAFGTATITATLTASPGGIATAEAFGTVDIQMVSPITASPTGIASLEAFGTPTVALTLTASPGAIASGETFGTPTVALTLTASPGAIGSAETFGTPVVALTLTASPSGIASGEAVGTPSISTIYTVTPDGIVSAEAFGSPVVDIPITAAPAGIASAEAVGTPTISTGYVVIPDGIASAETFGSPVVGLTLTASPSGVASGETLGSPVVTATLAVAPGGIGSAEALGNPVVTIPITAAPSGIASEETFGTPAIVLGYDVVPTGIPSAEAFGSVTVSQVLQVGPESIGSAEAFGSPDVTLTLLVVVGGIGSEEAFGSPTIALNAHHAVITVTVPGRSRYAVGTGNTDGATNTPSTDTTNLGSRDRSGTNTPRNRGTS